jgi:hypothetical protein
MEKPVVFQEKVMGKAAHCRDSSKRRRKMKSELCVLEGKTWSGTITVSMTGDQREDDGDGDD